MEETIRAPDSSYYDRLVDSGPVDDYESAIQQSIMDYESHQIRIEQELYELYEKEKIERKNKFTNVKRVCNRLIAISPTDKPTLELFLSLIELYENGEMNIIDVDAEFYDKLFAILEKLRISKDDLENCKKIIQTR